MSIRLSQTTGALCGVPGTRLYVTGTQQHNCQPRAKARKLKIQSWGDWQDGSVVKTAPFSYGGLAPEGQTPSSDF